MNIKNLFKRGFASVALGAAMTSSIFAGNAAFIAVKVEYVNTSKTDSKDENVTAFKMHIEKGNIVATFDKGANHTNSETIKLALSKKVTGDRIENGSSLFKPVRVSSKSLMGAPTDAKIHKLTFAINQTGEANVLIISAASKNDLIAAMPLKVALSRIDAKMHLAVTTDEISFNDTVHLYTNNINLDQWNKKKEKVIFGNSKKQNDIKPQVILYSDATESTTDENMTNANLMNGDGKGSEAGKSSMFKSSLFAVVNNVIPNAATTNIGQRKIVFEPNYEHLAFKFSKTTTGEDSRISLTPYENLAFNFSGATADQKSKIILKPYSKQLAFNFSTTTTGEDSRKIFQTHKLRALNKFSFDSKTGHGAALNNMAA